jgi:hypothetical protein
VHQESGIRRQETGDRKRETEAIELAMDDVPQGPPPLTPEGELAAHGLRPIPDSRFPTPDSRLLLILHVN